MSDRDALIEAMARAVRAVGPNGFPDEYATAALAALEAAGVRMVPVDPNDTMLTAGMESDSIGHPWQALDVYRRMIAAYNTKETK